MDPINTPTTPQDPNQSHIRGMRRLVSTVQKLSYARTVEAVVEIVKTAARELTGADGATFILKEDDQCSYVDEDAIGPLWKGKKFPMSACVSGWAMIHRQEAVIEDIYQDLRVPVDAYRPTFVKSMVMVPIRKEQPIGAIGNYWASPRRPNRYEIELLQSLADSTSIALENANLYRNLQTSLTDARAARDEVARQLSLRDEFISVAAHELKTPLTPLLLQAQGVEKMISAEKFKDHPLGSRLEKFSTVLGKQLKNLDHLVENLLETSRITMDLYSIDAISDVDLGDLIRGVVEQYQSSSPSEIMTLLDPPLNGQWDPLKLHQLLGNLLSNAISYGLGKPIRIHASMQDSVAMIVIEDQGIGIAQKDQTRIFERFERATSMKSFGGMGLGLFISREIVHAHGGKLRLESEPQKGSRFTVELPSHPHLRPSSPSSFHEDER